MNPSCLTSSDVPSLAGEGGAAGEKWKFHDEIYTQKTHTEQKGRREVDIWMRKPRLNYNEVSAVC